MKLISYNQNGKTKLGALKDDMVYDLNGINSKIADNMQDFLIGGETQLLLSKAAVESGAPTISKSFAIVKVSLKIGTLLSVYSPGFIIHAVIRGKTAFFAPLILTIPFNESVELSINLSIFNVPSY